MTHEADNPLPLQQEGLPQFETTNDPPKDEGDKGSP